MTGMRTSSYGVASLETMKSMSGLEFLRGMIDGRFPQPPIAATLAFRLAEVEHGRALFIGTPDARHLNPLGTIHGGYAATLLDSCMSCAVHTLLEQGQGYTTLEFKINLVRAITETTGEVRAEGQIVHPGRRAASSQGRITDAKGNLLAHGTATCLVFAI